jgi:hydroxymethylpyrimidine pyrophosphatase-like HAD family hydrolase
MMIRALFLDIDGTLVGRSGVVSERVRGAVSRARDSGCEVVLCTGRSRVATEPIADQLGIRGWAVLSNGSVAMHLATREVLCRNVLSPDVARRAVGAFLEWGIGPAIYEDAIESARILYHPDYPVPFFDPSRHRPWPQMAEHLPFEPISVGCTGEESLLRPLARRLAAQMPETLVDESGTELVWSVGVLHQSSGKCNGLRRVAEQLGVAREEILGIGDHLNDLEMLRFAGIGVAMGNALPEVLAAAGHVTGTLAEDGAAQAIERFVLGSVKR